MFTRLETPASANHRALGKGGVGVSRSVLEAEVGVEVGMGEEWPEATPGWATAQDPLSSHC